jgi:endonuclease YncB( thermonuclease family)
MLIMFLIALATHQMNAAAHAQTRVIDGDTIVYHGQRVRIAYLNCPELFQPNGHAAKYALRNRLAGRHIQIKPVNQPKSYGRTVAKVFASGRDVARGMIYSGICAEACRFSVPVYGAGGKYGRCP